jgi:hypothetical protein
LWCDDPIDHAADTQARQLRETLSPFCTHTQPRRDFFDCAVTFSDGFIR